LLNEMGLQQGTKAVEKFGIPLQEKDHALGIALGGMHEGTSPLAMAQAYSTFANNGTMVEAHAILKIEDIDGKVIAKWKSKSTAVTKPEVAQKITYMLRGVVKEGTGKKAFMEGLDIAGKTGSTQLPFANEGGTKDHWFVGYTPDIVGAVWLGYDQTDENHYLATSSSGTTPVIFKEILAKSKSVLSDEKFALTTVEKKYKNEVKKIKEKEEKARKEKEKEEKEKNKGKGNGKGKEKNKEKKDKDKEKERDEEEEDEDEDEEDENE
jgi:penicillin-binding protein 2A